MDIGPLMKLFAVVVGVPLFLGVCEYAVLYLVRRALARARQKSQLASTVAPAPSRDGRWPFLRLSGARFHFDHPGRPTVRSQAHRPGPLADRVLRRILWKPLASPPSEARRRSG
jgi:hypothetical protein